MRILEKLRNRPPRTDAGDPGSAEASPTDTAQLPIADYEQLDHKKVGARLRHLSQVELSAVEAYERSHQDRPEVLDKLRYMRGAEPLPDYDALSPERIADVLADADAETVKAVRDYERRFGQRRQVLDDAARVLPTAAASPAEDLAREEKVARVREGFAGRAHTADGLGTRGSAPDA